VKPYPYLTEEGKIRRMRGLAERALDQYNLDVRRLTCVARQRHTTFRVETVSGYEYALRVGARPSRTDGDTATELAWLEALTKDPFVSAARPIRNRKRKLITYVSHEGVPERRPCVLFDWIPGQPVGDAADRADYGMMGELAAHLHDHAEKWKPGRRRLAPLVWDRVFYYPAEPVVLYDGRFRRVMTPERTEVVREIETRAAAELTRLHEQTPLMMLHGGLQPWKVHLHGGRLHVLDFEDVMLGAPVQDLAITLSYNRQHPEYEQLLAAFVEGYRSIREWPVEYEGQLLLLMAARSVMLINYVLRMGVAADEYIAVAVEQMTELL
jgi:Ser/Thr protein kinase RdoA (MazF antagonist)